MLKPADFSALPGAALSGLFSVTPVDFIPPTPELGFKTLRNWAGINKRQFFHLEHEASPHPAEPGSLRNRKKGKTWFSLLSLFCSRAAVALCWFVLALECCMDRLASGTAPWDVSGSALPSVPVPSAAEFVRAASAAVSNQVLNRTHHPCPPHLEAVTNAKRDTY